MRIIRPGWAVRWEAWHGAGPSETGRNSRPNAPCDGKTAHVAYIVIAKKDDVTNKSHNQGDYYAYIRVTDDDIKPSENANPVKTLRMRYDAWKKAGSSRFSSL